MDSDLARQAEQKLIEATKQLTPEQRLNAFLEHSRLMVTLYAAGFAYRNQPHLAPQNHP